MINVIGLGYIGLPTALMFASHGCEVVGTDYNPQLIATLNAGHASFEEKGLDELFADALSKGIRFSTDFLEAQLMYPEYLEEVFDLQAEVMLKNLEDHGCGFDEDE